MPNVLDEVTFTDDLERLPGDQKYLRNGWNSDPSWDWSQAARLATLIRDAGRLTIFVTKSFKALRPDIVTPLVAARAELGVSISAFDTLSQLKQRLTAIETFRSAGGVAIPLVMTTRFADSRLNSKQERIVEYVAERDFPAAENSLRVNPSSRVGSLLDLASSTPVEQSGEVWFGRLYPEVLRVPTTTSVPSTYSGLHSAYLSLNPSAFLESLWEDAVPTSRELAGGSKNGKPAQCGVPIAWPSFGPDLVGNRPRYTARA